MTRAILRLRAPARLPPHRQYTTSTPPPPPPPPSSPPKEPSRVGAFYRTFSYPILKTFLGALFTYQLTYYAWLKLEWAEEKQGKKLEVEGLKEELRGVVVERWEEEKGKQEKGKVGKVEGEVQGGKKKGWFW